MSAIERPSTSSRSIKVMKKTRSLQAAGGGWGGGAGAGGEGGQGLRVQWEVQGSVLMGVIRQLEFRVQGQSYIHSPACTERPPFWSLHQ